VADQHGLEGIVSKRRDSRCTSGRSDTWLKTKCFTEGVFDVLGVERTTTGEVNALLARPEGGYAGRAFVTLSQDDRQLFHAKAKVLETEIAPPGVKAASARWLRPGLQVRVRFLRGEEHLRHATLLSAA
jgi:bifunctional non-homologous end joining protein LigD